MATPKKAALVFEMGGQQIPLKDIEAAVKSAGPRIVTAYVNTAECAVYCVDSDGNTTKASLLVD